MNKNENNILDSVYQQEQQEIKILSQQLLDLYHIEYNTTRPKVLSKLFVKADLSRQKGTHQKYQQEHQEIKLLSQQLLDLYHIKYNTTRPKVLSKLFVKADLSRQKERHTSKVIHSYYERKVIDDPHIDKQPCNAWRKDKYLTLEVENYISVVQDQELPTKFMKSKKGRYRGKNPSCNNKCRLCINNVDDINHIVAGCSQISARYYLHLRHDEVAKTVLNSHLKNACPAKLITLSSDPEYIYTKKQLRILV